MHERRRRWLDDVACDLGYTCRVLLRRDRGFGVAAIAMLALAVALNGIVFTVVDAMLFRGFPLVTRNDRLVAIQEIAPSGLRGVSYPDFQEWAAQARSFEGMSFVMSGVRIGFAERSGHPTEPVTFKVTANTFGLLGVPPIRGRDFVPADEVPGASPVVILNISFGRTGSASARPSLVRPSRSTARPRRASASCPRASTFRIR